jgi:hypothetical protein
MKMRDNPRYENFRIKCLICKDDTEWKYLGSHINKKHKITCKRYKEMFGLPHNLSLMNEEIKDKKKKAFNQRREHYLKNILGNKQFQFKKGSNRHEKNYFSLLEKTELIKRIQEKELKGNCPICNMLFENIYSHLFNAHRLLFVGEIENEMQIM